jgi:hypothetical protein
VAELDARHHQPGAGVARQGDARDVGAVGVVAAEGQLFRSAADTARRSGREQAFDLAGLLLSTFERRSKSPCERAEICAVLPWSAGGSGARSPLAGRL